MTWDFTGASGAGYRFSDIPEPQGPTRAGGLFAYVREEPGGPILLYVGETENLSANFRLRWDEAVREHGATHLLMRLGLSGRVRRADQIDLISAYRPVMNPEPRDSEPPASEAAASSPP